MELVRARLGHQVHSAASATAILRRHVQAQLLELLDRILNRRVHGSAAQTLVGDTVDEEAIEVLADTVDYSHVAVFKIGPANVDGARSELHEVENVAPVDGQIGDLFGADCRG